MAPSRLDSNGHVPETSTEHQRFDAGDASVPIAIIGIATRFPHDADNTANLWSMLLKGRSTWGPFPKDRINPEGHYHPDPEHSGTFAVKGGHFLKDDPAYFDAPFFNITKNEVLTMDPQQRVILENVYQALENAGIPITEASSSNTSVYVSGFNHDHLGLLAMDSELNHKYKPTGISNSLLSNRVSWFFDFNGPSITLDTACSSSMVALHLGCQSLATGESNMGIISGVTIFSSPVDMVSMSHHGFLGPSGRSFSFDHRAEGYARGEGVGTVIVKRLSDALRDGDAIRAVVRGTGTNQDGRTTGGIALPSAPAQEALIRSVYKKSGLDFKDTRMVEAHGTGTAAGDPLEATAIARVFGSSRSPEEPMIVGAVKSVVGHMEGGSAMAGIIKGILILESGIIPPNQNFEKVNPRIPVKKFNITFPLEPTPWPSEGLRRLSINSFGVGGSNAHVILDDAFNYLRSRDINGLHNTVSKRPSKEEIQDLIRRLSDLENDPEIPEKESSEANTDSGGVNATKDHHDSAANGVNGHGTLSHVNGTNGTNKTNGTKCHENGVDGTPSTSTHLKIFTLSHFDEGGCQRAALNLVDHLATKAIKSTIPMSDNQVSDYLENLAHTLSKKRDEFPWKTYAIASSLEQLVSQFSQANLPKAVRSQVTPKIGFVFTGQGSQWFAMGRELLVYPSFRNDLVNADEYFRSLGAEWSLIDELAKDKDQSNVNEPWLSHPACVSLQIAVFDLLHSWGIVAGRVVGHSSGEIAAAYAASRLSKEAAWKAAYYRGYVSSKKLDLKGSMMAVGLPAKETQAWIDKLGATMDGELCISCYNSPANQTVSGDEAKIDALKSLLDKEGGIFARKLNVLNAYHSSHMTRVADEYKACMGNLDFGEPRSIGVEMFSSVTGEQVTETHLDAKYWVDNMVSPVRFQEAVTGMFFKRLETGQPSLKLNSSAENVLVDTVLEVGPHGAMRSAIQEILATRTSASLFNYRSILSRAAPGLENVLNTIAFIHTLGVAVNLEAVNNPTGYRKPHMLVDLPPYSFNHTDRNVAESRYSKDYRLRSIPKHDLLGAPAADWDVNNPRWRNVIRQREQPWIKDHIVTNIVVYPGVGYLAAVLEASKQMADPEQTLVAFRFRDVSLKRALAIPESKDGVEISVSLTAMDEASLQASSIWKRFAIASYDPASTGWIEHATGYIATDYQTNDGPIDEGKEAIAEKEGYADRLAKARETCISSIDMRRAYDEFGTVGLAFGPLFRNVTEANGTLDQSGESFGTITVPDVQEVMPKKFMHPHMIHPATMDSFMHLFVCAIIDTTSKRKIEHAMVPTFIKDIWVSVNVNKKPGETFIGHGKARKVAFDKFESEVTIWDSDTEAPLVSLKGIKASPLDSADTKAAAERKLCHNMVRTLDPDLMEASDIEIVKQTAEQREATYDLFHKWQIATALRVTDALTELEADPDFDPSALEGHFANYWEWMNMVRQMTNDGTAKGYSFEDWEQVNVDAQRKQGLFDYIHNSGPGGELSMRMGENIVKVLRKQVDPLHLMFGIDDLMDRVYLDLVSLGNIPAYNAKYLDTYAKANANLKILEVGAGVGSSTVPVLQSLAPLTPDAQAIDISKLRIEKYTFTDISSGFFSKAMDKFKAHEPIMEYKTFNAELDPEGQGLMAGSYDLIFAGNVIHATKDLRKTLSQVRKLLKPSGKLVLQEGIRNDDLGRGVAFGQLSGWWLSVEPERKWGPWISLPGWESALKDAGFYGIDYHFDDQETDLLHTQSVIVATAAHLDTSSSLSKIWHKTYIVSSEVGGSDLANALKDRLSQRFGIPQCSILHHFDVEHTDISEALCLSVLEYEKEILANPSQKEYENIRQLLVVAGALHWITGDVTAHPQLGMASGLVRTVRWERDIEETNLSIVSVQEPYPAQEQLLDSLTRFFENQAIRHLPAAKCHGEYALLPNGTFKTYRVIEDDNANTFLASRLSNPQPVEMRYGDAGRPIRLITTSPGQLDRLQWVTDEAHTKPLPEDEVEVEIKAVGLNFRDLMVAMGEPMAYCFGYEASGIVTKVGSACQKIQPGQRVAFMCGTTEDGCFQTYARSKEEVTVVLPENVSFTAAAGMICVYSTVIYGLENAARLEKGETILIHAAAGGVGQAAVHYAKYVGAEIFATVSTPEKRKLLIEEYGIPEDHIFSSRDDTFVKGILRMTNGRGVDCVLNSLAGELLRKSWELIAPFGRFVEIGKKDAQLKGRVALEPFLRNVTMTSVEIATILTHRPKLLHDLTKKTLDLYSEGHIGEAKPTKVMSFSEISDGFRTLQSGKGMGKMVFVPSPDDIVPIVPVQLPGYKLEGNASYVLAGGLGGIGRSLGRWMAKKGARHLIFLSRSGKVTGDAIDMVQELEKSGCTVSVFACDVSDTVRMKEVFEECARTLPPIKGCIQGSMVLQDKIFENMSHDMYMAAVKPKVHGSWNLHNLLPSDIDFFVMLSSVAGIIGNRSQANYNAGNAFQDALCKFRRANKMPCTTIDVGTVIGVGYVAEQQSLEALNKIRGAVYELIKEEELHHLIEYLMDPRWALEQGTGQMISGLTYSHAFRKGGMPPPTYLNYPAFTHLRVEGAVASGESSDSKASVLFKLQAQIVAATTPDEAAAVMLEIIQVKLSNLLDTPVDNINPKKSVSSNGIDSLIAMEFRAFLVKDIGADVPLLDITGTLTVQALSAKIVGISKLTQHVHNKTS